MKKINLFTLVLFIATSAMVFTSCEKDNNNNSVEIKSKVAYVVNYGSYSGSNGEISIYSKDSSRIFSNTGFLSANDVPFSSKIQSMALFNDRLYLMSNNGDKIDVLNAKTLTAMSNPITDNIVKPRCFAAVGNTAYVSCWGGDVWVDNTLSYIAKIDLTTKNVTKIMLAGGPEGMAIVNNKLYAALNYKDSIAVVDLSDESISYIQTPAVSSYFLEDNQHNLYVSFVNSYSNPTESEGLGYINTSSNTLENTYLLSGVSTNYGGIMDMNADKSKIYVMTTAYDSNWVLSGSVQVFNTISKEFENPFVENITGINGLAVDPENDDVYVLISPDASTSGTMKRYNSVGTFLDEETTGLSPQNIIFYEVK